MRMLAELVVGVFLCAVLSVWSRPFTPDIELFHYGEIMLVFLLPCWWVVSRYPGGKRAVKPVGTGNWSVTIPLWSVAVFTLVASIPFWNKLVFIVIANINFWG